MSAIAVTYDLNELRSPGPPPPSFDIGPGRRRECGALISRRAHLSAHRRLVRHRPAHPSSASAQRDRSRAHAHTQCRTLGALTGAARTGGGAAARDGAGGGPPPPPTRYRCVSTQCERACTRTRRTATHRRRRHSARRCATCARTHTSKTSRHACVGRNTCLVRQRPAADPVVPPLHTSVCEAAQAQSRLLTCSSHSTTTTTTTAAAAAAAATTTAATAAATTTLVSR
jgi:hypothetical protein